MTENKNYFIWILSIFASGILWGIYFVSDYLDLYPLLKFSGLFSVCIILIFYRFYGKKVFDLKKYFNSLKAKRDKTKTVLTAKVGDK